MIRLLGIFGLVFALLAPTAAAGGEDFPFFCRLGGDLAGESFKVLNDRGSPSGYVAHLFDRGRNYASMAVWISESADKKHHVIYGRQQIPLLRDRQFLAYIAKAGTASSGGDVQTTFRNADTTFYLSPASCGLYR